MKCQWCSREIERKSFNCYYTLDNGKRNYTCMGNSHYKWGYYHMPSVVSIACQELASLYSWQ
jgi:hypothetical protein